MEELHEDRNLFVRMIIVYKSLPEIEIQEAPCCQDQGLLLMVHYFAVHVRMP